MLVTYLATKLKPKDAAQKLKIKNKIKIGEKLLQ